MIFSEQTLLLLGTAYLLVLFGIARLAQSRFVPERVFQHPLLYVLALGVFACSWAIYGVVGVAYQYGNLFLGYYLGAVGMFVFAPFFLVPILKLCRIYQLSSLADLLAFRFRSQWVGALVTIGMLAALMPLLAVQFKAIGDSVHILTSHSAEEALSTSQPDQVWLLCVIIGLFAVLFGSQPPNDRQQQRGLMAAIAFESLVKLIALSVLGAAAITLVFGGLKGLDVWLLENDDVLTRLYADQAGNSSRIVLLVFFASAVALPHMFHMIFAENPSMKVLSTASWGLPAYLLVISLPILPLVWAAQQMGSDLPPEYAPLALGIGLQSTKLAAVAYLTGMSAASATVIVSTLALANMCLNYLILPWLLKQPVPPGEVSPQDMYTWLRWMRALLITSIVSLGYLFFRYVEYRTTLADLGMIAFIGTLQFLPGIVASLHWRQANRIGLIVGLLGGFGIWYLTLLLPVLGTPHPLLVFDVVGINHSSDLSNWTLSSIYSLGLNTALFILVSLLTQRSQQEKLSAEICSTDPTDRPLRTTLVPKTIEQFIDNLAGVMGKSNSEDMVNRSLSELRLSSTETRPYALRSLRNRIEANLSGLFGPGVAHEIVERCIPYQLGLHPFSEDMNLIENRLDTTTLPLTGLAADLDSLRRYHRDTLHNLPIGVCCMADDGEVLMWNRSMEKMTGLAADNIVGADFAEMPQPWLALLTELRQGSSVTLHKCKIDIPGQTPRWVSLNRSAIESHETANRDEIIVMEDITDYQRLEQELMHTERLASVGRIAAGVAHEIGNPITGIACLAQNLREETSDESVQESANDILSQTERVSRIVHVLVNYSHGGKAAQLPVETRPVNVQHCATEAIQLLTLDKDAKDVVYLNNCEPGHEVSADPQRLLQILINLLSNARDASAPGQCVTVSSEDRGTDVTISVIDDGSGIAAEHQDQLFEPFFTTKDPGEGTGLGLSLVYSIVDELGGQIYFASPWNTELRSGTRFSVSLSNSPLSTGNITQ